MPGVLPLLLALSIATSAGPKAPTSAAYRKTFENNQHTLVEVIGPSHRGPGVIVGEAGEVLTSVDNVGLTEAKVRFGKTEQPAKVVLANAYLKVALVRPERPPGLRAPAVRAAETFEAQALADRDREGALGAAPAARAAQAEAEGARSSTPPFTFRPGPRCSTPRGSSSASR